MPQTHEMSQRTTPVSVIVVCSCGWSRSVSRRQNALARSAKVRAAYHSHEREIEATTPIKGDWLVHS